MTHQNDDSTESAPVSDVDPGQSSKRWDQAERPSIAVVEAVAAETDRDPTDVPPLQGRIDTDALDTLVTAANQTGDGVVVSFEYDGVDVSLDSDGTLDVRHNGHLEDRD